MFDIKVSKKIKEVCPNFKGAAILCDVVNVQLNTALWVLIEREIYSLNTTLTIDSIKANSVIHATREVYRKLGKDPNRYRPSSEALCRRIVRGLPLYQVSSIVDLINLVSLKTGYCIGGFDADKIEGSKLVLGVGEHDEPYEAIGRGVLNIEGLPVYRDGIGGIGTPTSDHERTKLGLESARLLALFNGYDGGTTLDETVKYTQDLLSEYGGGKDFEIVYYE